MRISHTDNYREACHEVQRRRDEPDGEQMINKIIPSPYGGCDVVTFDPELYADMMAGEIAVLPSLRSAI